MISRTVEPAAPFDLGATLGALGPKPVGRVPSSRTGRWWLSLTPEGPVSVRLEHIDTTVTGMAWGPGAGWALDRLDSLLGLDDDPAAFTPPAGPVAELHRRNPGFRLGRTGRVFDLLLPIILGQRVTSIEAERAYRRIVRSHGTPAPGPIEAWVPPAPDVIARLGYADLHSFGVERSRASIVIEAARRAARLEEIVDMSPEEATARLHAVRGIGPWTSAQVMGAAMGLADVVPVGDYHIPNMVSWALAGEPRGDDSRMLELLEPYRGQRRRALLLLKASGIKAPRYGPKTALRDFTRM